MAGNISAKRLKAIVGGSAGNFVEWYDWFAYSVLSISALIKAKISPAHIVKLGVALPYALIAFLMLPETPKNSLILED
jgi:hypothetical protein